MALFQKNPERDVADKIGRQIKARDDNAARLKAAESGLTACRTAVDQAALDDDDEKRDAALAAKRVPEDKVGALRDASIKISKAIADLEKLATAIADQMQRAATASEIERIAVDLERAGAAFEQAAKELAATSRRAADAALDAHPLTAYAMGAEKEVPPAVEVVATILRNRARDTISGSAPATLPQPEVPAPKQAVVPLRTMEIAPRQHLKFVNSTGVVVRIGRLQRHNLPEHLAKEALRTGLAVAAGDPSLRGQIGVFGMGVPPDSQCKWLGPPSTDTAPKTVAAPVTPPILHSAFEAEVIGKPMVGTMSVRQPTASARSAAPDEG